MRHNEHEMAPAELLAARQVLRAAVRAGLERRAPEVFGVLVLSVYLPHSIIVWPALLGEGALALVRLRRGVVDRQPVARVADGDAPDEIAPRVDLLFGVAQR